MWNMSECHFAWRAHLIIIPLPIDQVGLRTTFCSKMGASYKIGVQTTAPDSTQVEHVISIHMGSTKWGGSTPPTIKKRWISIFVCARPTHFAEEIGRRYITHFASQCGAPRIGLAVSCITATKHECRSSVAFCIP